MHQTGGIGKGECRAGKVSNTSIPARFLESSAENPGSIGHLIPIAGRFSGTSSTIEKDDASVSSWHRPLKFGTIVFPR